MMTMGMIWAHPRANPPTPGNDNQDGEGPTEAVPTMDATGGGVAAAPARYRSSKIAEEKVKVIQR